MKINLSSKVTAKDAKTASISSFITFCVLEVLPRLWSLIF